MRTSSFESKDEYPDTGFPRLGISALAVGRSSRHPDVRSSDSPLEPLDDAIPTLTESKLEDCSQMCHSEERTQEDCSQICYAEERTQENCSQMCHSEERTQEDCSQVCHAEETKGSNETGNTESFNTPDYINDFSQRKRDTIGNLQNNASDDLISELDIRTEITSSEDVLDIDQEVHIQNLKDSHTDENLHDLQDTQICTADGENIEGFPPIRLYTEKEENGKLFVPEVNGLYEKSWRKPDTVISTCLRPNSTDEVDDACSSIMNICDFITDHKPKKEALRTVEVASRIIAYGFSEESDSSCSLAMNDAKPQRVFGEENATWVPSGEADGDEQLEALMDNQGNSLSNYSVGRGIQDNVDGEGADVSEPMESCEGSEPGEERFEDAEDGSPEHFLTHTKRPLVIPKVVVHESNATLIDNETVNRSVLVQADDDATVAMDYLQTIDEETEPNSLDENRWESELKKCEVLLQESSNVSGTSDTMTDPDEVLRKVARSLERYVEIAEVVDGLLSRRETNCKSSVEAEESCKSLVEAIDPLHRPTEIAESDEANMESPAGMEDLKQLTTEGNNPWRLLGPHTEVSGQSDETAKFSQISSGELCFPAKAASPKLANEQPQQTSENLLHITEKKLETIPCPSEGSREATETLRETSKETANDLFGTTEVLHEASNHLHKTDESLYETSGNFEDHPENSPEGRMSQHTVRSRDHMEVLRVSKDHLEVGRGSRDQSEVSRGSGDQSEVSRGSRDHFEVSRGSEDQSEVSRGSEDQSEVSRGSEDQSEVSRGSEDQSEVSRGSGDQSEVSRGSKDQSEASRGSGDQSEVSRGSKDQSEASRGSRDQSEAERSNKEQLEMRRDMVEDGELKDADENEHIFPCTPTKETRLYHQSLGARHAKCCSWNTIYEGSGKHYSPSYGMPVEACGSPAGVPFETSGSSGGLSLETSVIGANKSLEAHDNPKLCKHAANPKSSLSSSSQPPPPMTEGGQLTSSSEVARTDVLFENGILEYENSKECYLVPFEIQSDNSLGAGSKAIGRSRTNLSPPGPVSGTNLSPPGPVSGTNLSTPGPVSGRNLSLPGPVSGTSLSPPGPVSGTNLSTPGPVSGTNLSPPGPVSRFRSMFETRSLEEISSLQRGKTSGKSEDKSQYSDYKPPSTLPVGLETTRGMISETDTDASHDPQSTNKTDKAKSDQENNVAKEKLTRKPIRIPVISPDMARLNQLRVDSPPDNTAGVPRQPHLQSMELAAHKGRVKSLVKFNRLLRSVQAKESPVRCVSPTLQTLQEKIPLPSSASGSEALEASASCSSCSEASDMIALEAEQRVSQLRSVFEVSRLAAQQRTQRAFSRKLKKFVFGDDNEEPLGTEHGSDSSEMTPGNGATKMPVSKDHLSDRAYSSESTGVVHQVSHMNIPGNNWSNVAGVSNLDEETRDSSSNVTVHQPEEPKNLETGKSLTISDTSVLQDELEIRQDNASHTTGKLKRHKKSEKLMTSLVTMEKNIRDVQTSVQRLSKHYTTGPSGNVDLSPKAAQDHDLNLDSSSNELKQETSGVAGLFHQVVVMRGTVKRLAQHFENAETNSSALKDTSSADIASVLPPKAQSELGYCKETDGRDKIMEGITEHMNDSAEGQVPGNYQVPDNYQVGTIPHSQDRVAKLELQVLPADLYQHTHLPPPEAACVNEHKEQCKGTEKISMKAMDISRERPSLPFGQPLGNMGELREQRINLVTPADELQKQSVDQLRTESYPTLGHRQEALKSVQQIQKPVDQHQEELIESIDQLQREPTETVNQLCRENIEPVDQFQEKPTDLDGRPREWSVLKETSGPGSSNEDPYRRAHQAKIDSWNREGSIRCHPIVPIGRLQVKAHEHPVQMMAVGVADHPLQELQESEQLLHDNSGFDDQTGKTTDNEYQSIMKNIPDDQLRKFGVYFQEDQSSFIDEQEDSDPQGNSPVRMGIQPESSTTARLKDDVSNSIDSQHQNTPINVWSESKVSEILQVANTSEKNLEESRAVLEELSTAIQLPKALNMSSKLQMASPTPLKMDESTSNLLDKSAEHTNCLKESSLCSELLKDPPTSKDQLDKLNSLPDLPDYANVSSDLFHSIKPSDSLENSTLLLGFSKERASPPKLLRDTVELASLLDERHGTVHFLENLTTAADLRQANTSAADLLKSGTPADFLTDKDAPVSHLKEPYTPVSILKEPLEETIHVGSQEESTVRTTSKTQFSGYIDYVEEPNATVDVARAKQPVNAHEALRKPLTPPNACVPADIIEERKLQSYASEACIQTSEHQGRKLFSPSSVENIDANREDSLVSSVTKESERSSGQDSCVMSYRDTGVPKRRTVQPVSQHEVPVPGVVVFGATAESGLDCIYKYDTNLNYDSDNIHVEDVANCQNTYDCLQDQVSVDVIAGGKTYRIIPESLCASDVRENEILESNYSSGVSTNEPINSDKLRGRELGSMPFSAGYSSGEFSQEIEVSIQFPAEADETSPDKSEELEEHRKLLCPVALESLPHRPHSPLHNFFCRTGEPVDHSDDDLPLHDHTPDPNRPQELMQDKPAIPQKPLGGHLSTLEGFNTDEVASEKRFVLTSHRTVADSWPRSYKSALNPLSAPSVSSLLGGVDIPTCSVEMTPHGDAGGVDSIDTAVNPSCTEEDTVGATVSPSLAAPKAGLPSIQVSLETLTTRISLSEMAPNFTDTSEIPTDYPIDVRHGPQNTSVHENILKDNSEESLFNLLAIVSTEAQVNSAHGNSIQFTLKDDPRGDSSAELKSIDAEVETYWNVSSSLASGQITQVLSDSLSNDEECNSKVEDQDEEADLVKEADLLQVSNSYLMVEEPGLENSDDSDFSFGTEDCGDPLIPKQFIDAMLISTRAESQQEQLEYNALPGRSVEEDSDPDTLKCQTSFSISQSKKEVALFLTDGSPAELRHQPTVAHMEDSVLTRSQEIKANQEAATANRWSEDNKTSQEAPTATESTASKTHVKVDEQNDTDTDDSDFTFGTEDSGDIFHVPQRYIDEQLAFKDEEKSSKNMISLPLAPNDSNSLDTKFKRLTRTPWNSIDQDLLDGQRENATVLDSAELLRRISEIHSTLQASKETSQDAVVESEKKQASHEIKSSQDISCHMTPAGVEGLVLNSTSETKESYPLSPQPNTDSSASLSTVDVSAVPSQPPTRDTTSGENGSETDSDDDMRVGPLKSSQPLVIPLSASPSMSTTPGSDSDSSNSESDALTDEDDIEVCAVKKKPKYTKPARSHRSKLHTIQELSEDEEERDATPIRPPRQSRLTGARSRLTENWWKPDFPKVHQASPKTTNLCSDFSRKLGDGDGEVSSTKVMGGSRHNDHPLAMVKLIPDNVSSSSSGDDYDDDGDIDEPVVTYGRLSYTGIVFKKMQKTESLAKKNITSRTSRSSKKASSKSETNAEQINPERDQILQAGRELGPGKHRNSPELEDHIIQKINNGGEKFIETMNENYIENHTGPKINENEEQESLNNNVMEELASSNKTENLKHKNLNKNEIVKYEDRNENENENDAIITRNQNIQTKLVDPSSQELSNSKPGKVNPRERNPRYPQKEANSTVSFLEEEADTTQYFFPPMETLFTPASPDPIIITSSASQSPAVKADVPTITRYVVTHLGRESVLTDHTFAPPMEKLLKPTLQIAGEQVNDHFPLGNEFERKFQGQSCCFSMIDDLLDLRACKAPQFLDVGNSELGDAIALTMPVNGLTRPELVSENTILHKKDYLTMAAEGANRDSKDLSDFILRCSKQSETNLNCTNSHEENTKAEVDNEEILLSTEKPHDLETRENVLKCNTDRNEISKGEDFLGETIVGSQVPAVGEISQETELESISEEARGNHAISEEYVTNQGSKEPTDEGTLEGREYDGSINSPADVDFIEEPLTSFQSSGPQQLGCFQDVIDPTEAVTDKGESKGSISAEASPVMAVELTQSTSNVVLYSLGNNRKLPGGASSLLQEPKTLTWHSRDVHLDELSDVFPLTIDTFTVTASSDPFSVTSSSDPFSVTNSDPFSVTTSRDSFSVTTSRDPFSQPSKMGSWAGECFSDETMQASSFCTADVKHALQAAKGSLSGDGEHSPSSQGEVEKPGSAACPSVVPQTPSEESVATASGENLKRIPSHLGGTIMDTNPGFAIPEVQWDTFPIFSGISPDDLVAVDASSDTSVSTPTLEADEALTVADFDTRWTSFDVKETECGEGSPNSLGVEVRNDSDIQKVVCNAPEGTGCIKEELSAPHDSREQSPDAQVLFEPSNPYLRTTENGGVLTCPHAGHQGVDLNTCNSSGLDSPEALHLHTRSPAEHASEGGVAQTDGADNEWHASFSSFSSSSSHSSYLLRHAKDYEDALPIVDLLGLEPRSLPPREETNATSLLNLESPDHCTSRNLQKPLEDDIQHTRYIDTVDFVTGSLNDIPNSTHSEDIKPQDERDIVTNELFAFLRGSSESLIDADNPGSTSSDAIQPLVMADTVQPEVEDALAERQTDSSEEDLGTEQVITSTQPPCWVLDSGFGSPDNAIFVDDSCVVNECGEVIESVKTLYDWLPTQGLDSDQLQRLGPMQEFGSEPMQEFDSNRSHTFDFTPIQLQKSAPIQMLDSVSLGTLDYEPSQLSDTDSEYTEATDTKRSSSPATHTNPQHEAQLGDTTINIHEADPGHDPISDSQTNGIYSLLASVRQTLDYVSVYSEGSDDRGNQCGRGRDEGQEYLKETSENGISHGGSSRSLGQPGHTPIVERLISLEELVGEAANTAEDLVSQLKEGLSDKVLNFAQWELDDILVENNSVKSEADEAENNSKLSTNLDGPENKNEKQDSSSCPAEEVCGRLSPEATVKNQLDTASPEGTESHTDKENTLSEISSDIFESARDLCPAIDEILIHKLSVLDSDVTEDQTDAFLTHHEKTSKRPEDGDVSSCFASDLATLQTQDRKSDDQDHNNSLYIERINGIFNEFQHMLNMEGSTPSSMLKPRRHSQYEDLIVGPCLSASDSATGHWVSEAVGLTASSSTLQLGKDNLINSDDDVNDDAKTDDSIHSQSHHSLLHELHECKGLSNDDNSGDERSFETNPLDDGSRRRPHSRTLADLVTSRQQFWNSLFEESEDVEEAGVSSLTSSPAVTRKSADLTRSGAVTGDENKVSEHHSSAEVSRSSEHIHEDDIKMHLFQSKQEIRQGLVKFSDTSLVEFSGASPVKSSSNTSPVEFSSTSPTESSSTSKVESNGTSLVESYGTKIENVLKKRVQTKKNKERKFKYFKRGRDTSEESETDGILDPNYKSCLTPKPRKDKTLAVLPKGTFSERENAVSPKVGTDRQKFGIQKTSDQEGGDYENIGGLSRMPSFKKIEKGIVRSGKKLWEGKQMEQSFERKLCQSHVLPSLRDANKNSKCSAVGEQMENKFEAGIEDIMKNTSEPTESLEKYTEIITSQVMKESFTGTPVAPQDGAPAYRRPSIKMIAKGIVQMRKSQWEGKLEVTEESELEETPPSNEEPATKDDVIRPEPQVSDRRGSLSQQKHRKGASRHKPSLGYQLSVKIKNGTVVDTKLLWEAREVARKKELIADLARAQATIHAEDAQIPSDEHHGKKIPTTSYQDKDSIARSQEPEIEPPQTSEGVDAREVVRCDEPLSEPNIQEGRVNSTRQMWLSMTTSDGMNAESILKSKVRSQKNKKGPKLRESGEESFEKSLIGRHPSVRIPEGAVLEEKKKLESIMIQLKKGRGIYVEWKKLRKSRNVKASGPSGLRSDRVPTVLKPTETDRRCGDDICLKEIDPDKVMERVPGFEQIKKGTVLARQQIWSIGEARKTPSPNPKILHVRSPQGNIIPGVADTHKGKHDSPQDIEPVKMIPNTKIIAKEAVKCSRTQTKFLNAKNSSKTNDSNDVGRSKTQCKAEIASELISGGRLQAQGQQQAEVEEQPKTIPVSGYQLSIKIKERHVASIKNLWEGRQQEDRANRVLGRSIEDKKKQDSYERNSEESLHSKQDDDGDDAAKGTIAPSWKIQEGKVREEKEKWEDINSCKDEYNQWKKVRDDHSFHEIQMARAACPLHTRVLESQDDGKRDYEDEHQDKPLVQEIIPWRSEFCEFRFCSTEVEIGRKTDSVTEMLSKEPTEETNKGQSSSITSYEGTSQIDRHIKENTPQSKNILHQKMSANQAFLGDANPAEDTEMLERKRKSSPHKEFHVRDQSEMEPSATLHHETREPSDAQVEEVDNNAASSRTLNFEVESRHLNTGHCVSEQIQDNNTFAQAQNKPKQAKVIQFYQRDQIQDIAPSEERTCMLNPQVEPQDSKQRKYGLTNHKQDSRDTELSKSKSNRDGSLGGKNSRLVDNSYQEPVSMSESGPESKNKDSEDEKEKEEEEGDDDDPSTIPALDHPSTRKQPEIETWVRENPLCGTGLVLDATSSSESLERLFHERPKVSPTAEVSSDEVPFK
ncbi:uncharacterized protein [Procambarus clarkii]|uniref:uncharacterized protein n=1 Tax=Procambarus clarkii TaxID=6728 RepID=UPI003743DF11